MSNLGIAQSEVTGKSGSSGSSSTLNFRGAWSSITSYSTDDVVTRKGSAYVAVAGSTNQDPYLDTTQTFWKILTQGFNFVGTWLVGSSYNYFDVVILNKSFYLSVLAGEQTNTGHNPQTDAAGGVGTNWALLDQGFNFLGTYAGGTTYQQYDVVAYNSSSYISLQFANTGNQPDTSPTFWALLAQAGQVAPRQQTVFTMPSAPVTSYTTDGLGNITLNTTNTFAAQNVVVTPPGQGQVSTLYLSGFTGGDTFLNGQVVLIATNSGTLITATGATGGAVSGGAGTATGSIPINGVYWTTITLGKTFALSYIQCAQANRIELYSNQTSRTADASRAATSQPVAGTQHGVILDLNLDGVIAAFASWIASPLAYGADLQVPTAPTANIQAALTNIAGAATTNSFSITFTFTFEEQ